MEEKVINEIKKLKRLNLIFDYYEMLNILQCTKNHAEFSHLLDSDFLLFQTRINLPILIENRRKINLFICKMI